MTTTKKNNVETETHNNPTTGGDPMKVKRLSSVLVTLLMVALFSLLAFAQDENFEDDFGIDDDTEESLDEDFSIEDEYEEVAVQNVTIYFKKAAETVLLIVVDNGTNEPIVYFTTDVPQGLKEIAKENNLRQGNSDTFAIFADTGLKTVSLTKETIGPRLAYLLSLLDEFLFLQGCTTEDDTSALTNAQTLLAGYQSDLVDAEDDAEKASVETDIEKTKALIEELKVNPAQKWVCVEEKVIGFASIAETDGFNKADDETQTALTPFLEGMKKALEENDHRGVYLYGSALIEMLPDDIRENLVSTILGGIPVPFENIDDGDTVIGKDSNGNFFVGSASDKNDAGLTVTGSDGSKYKLPADATFWSITDGSGGGSSGVANLPGSAISLLIGYSFIVLPGSDVKDSYMSTVDFDMVLRANTHFGVFIGASFIPHVWGTKTGDGWEDNLTSGADRMYGYGRAGVLAGVNINEMWRFEGTAALLFNDSVGAEATVGITVTPHPVISIGLGCRAGYYPGNVRTGSRDYEVGGSESGPNLLNRMGVGPTITIGFNLPIGE